MWLNEFSLSAISKMVISTSASPSLEWWETSLLHFLDRTQTSPERIESTNTCTCRLVEPAWLWYFPEVRNRKETESGLRACCKWSPQICKFSWCNPQALCTSWRRPLQPSGSAGAPWHRLDQDQGHKVKVKVEMYLDKINGEDTGNADNATNSSVENIWQEPCPIL